MRQALLGLVLAFALAMPAMGGRAIPLLPDRSLTPGATDRSVTQANIHQTICVPGYTARVRNVPASEKRAIFAEYGLDQHGPGAPFEIDHLISLELGGSNDIRNLWPESYVFSVGWNAHKKDRLEDRLHALVCHDTIPLVEAQRAISTNWTAAYQKYVGT